MTKHGNCFVAVRDEKTTDTQYGEILEGVYDARIASDRLDKTYFEKFKRMPSVQENLSGAKSRDAFPPRTAERGT